MVQKRPFSSCSIATGAESKIARQEQGESTWDPLNASELAPNSANGLIPSLVAWAKSQPPGNVAIVSRFRVTLGISARTLIDPARWSGFTRVPGCRAEASVPREPRVPQKFQPVSVRLTRQQLRGTLADPIGVFTAQVPAVVQEELKQGAWFKSGLQLRGGWGRRPKGNAPRSEASALGARWLLPARSQPPNYRHLRGWQSGSSRPTPHVPMTLGANHVSRHRKGVTLPLLVISGLATGPPAGVGDGLRFLSTR